MPPSTKEQLVITAERLFALHGIDGVSLRQIAAEAGSSNNSAVRYHFGDKDDLVQAIFEYRLPDITRRRAILAATVSGGDLRGLVEAHLLPMVELAEGDDSHYLMFVEQLERYGTGEHPFTRLPEPLQRPHRDFVAAVSALLPGLPPPLRTVRIEQMTAICLHASADRERARRRGGRALPFALHLNGLFDGLVGFLLAPVSDPTRASLASSSPASRARSVLP